MRPKFLQVLGKRAAANPTQEAIVFIAVRLPVILMIVAVLVMLTVKFSTDFERTPDAVRGQLLVERLDACFGGSTWSYETVTSETLHSCYVVEENQRYLYPVRVTVTWTEQFVDEELVLESANTYAVDGVTLERYVHLEKEDVRYLAHVTYLLQEVSI